MRKAEEGFFRITLIFDVTVRRQVLLAQGGCFGGWVQERLVLHATHLPSVTTYLP